MRELERVKNALDHLKNRNQTKKIGLIKKLEQEEAQLEQKNEKLKEDTEEVETQFEYVSLFPEKSIDWDKKDIVLNKDKYKYIMKEIDDLTYFVEHQEDCLNYLYNKPYIELLMPFSDKMNINFEQNKLEYAYRYYALMQKSEKLEKEYMYQCRSNQLRNCVEEGKFRELNWKFIIDEKLLEEEAIKIINERLDEIERLQSNQTVISNVIAKLNSSRNLLIQQTKDAINQNLIDNCCCPLCGYRYSTSEMLYQNIEVETKKLQELCDESAEKIQEISNKLSGEYLDKLLEDIKNRNVDVVSEETYRKIQELKKYKIKIEEIKILLEAIGIILPEEYITDLPRLNLLYDDFITSIQISIKRLDKDVANELELRAFEQKYEKYYDKKNTLFSVINSEKLSEKKRYIKHLYLDFTVTNYENNLKKLAQIQKRKIKAEELYNELLNYQKTLQKAIDAYRKKIIGDIEPLLHLYTAKILQQKFNGKSIFIHTDETLNNMQLTNSNAYNQDILYNMSSGQLTAVSLAFLLCMNQVYAQHQNLPILLIDDPIQTIDDVNMVGLVDILRFEFSDRQIFISTHEKKFEWYLRYKFSKADLKIKLFNMKNLILENENIYN